MFHIVRWYVYCNSTTYVYWWESERDRSSIRKNVDWKAPKTHWRCWGTSYFMLLYDQCTVTVPFTYIKRERKREIFEKNVKTSIARKNASVERCLTYVDDCDMLFRRISACLRMFVSGLIDALNTLEISWNWAFISLFVSPWSKRNFLNFLERWSFVVTLWLWMIWSYAYHNKALIAW